MVKVLTDYSIDGSIEMAQLLVDYSNKNSIINELY